MNEIAHLLGLPEGRTLEFKRDMSSLRPILRTLVAFANTAGGTLIIGRDDDGQLRGVTNIQDEEERLTNTISDSIQPTLIPDIDVITVEEKDLLVVRVARWPGPFYIKALGAEEGVYIRLGSTNRKAGEEQLVELRRTARHLVFDQLPCVGAELEDLDIQDAHKSFEDVGRNLDETKLESLGVLIRYGRHLIPSNGGMILFGRDGVRQRFFPDAQVRCACFAGPDKAEFLDRLDIDGTVLEALEEVPKFIRRNARMSSRIQGMRRQDIPEYPRVALREALVNAVAHMDYTLRGMQIMVAVYQNRLEIQNPGMLPFGMTLDSFKAGVSQIRNPVISRVLRELDLMEEWGSGYKRITEDCDQGGYPYPEWVELDSVLRVTFFPHTEIANLSAQLSRDQVGTKSGPSRDQVQLLEFSKEERSLVELMALFGASNRTKFRQKFVRPLIDAGWLSMTIPDKPRSSKQRYVSTEGGLRFVTGSRT